MCNVFKKMILSAALFGLAAFPALAGDLPVIRLGTTLSMNNTSLFVPMVKKDAFVQDGYSLHEIIFKEKYELRKDGKGVAVMEFFYGKGGADIAMTIGQGNAEMGIYSLPAALAAIDKGVKIKVVAPYILATGSLTVHKDIPVKTMDDLTDYIRKLGKPFKIGYHSPTSAPILITRSSMASLGLTGTNDQYDTKANILYVNLKGLGNVQASLASHQVDAVVGPDPIPQIAEQNGYGRIVRMLRALPPDNKWNDFPCCTITSSEKFIAEQPGLLEHVIRWIQASGTWCTANPNEASSISGSLLGLDPRLSRAALPVYIDAMTPSWLKGAEANLKVLDETGYISGRLKGKTFDEASGIVIKKGFCK